MTDVCLAPLAREAVVATTHAIARTRPLHTVVEAVIGFTESPTVADGATAAVEPWQEGAAV